MTKLPTMSLLAFLAALFVIPAINAELEVIGSGYGRTGTLSLFEVLGALGYKTYHMKTIVDNKLIDHSAVWTDQAKNDCSDVEALKSLFEDGGYTAAVDFPTSMCWETLMKAYPNAKIVHTERESDEKWWNSASNTIMVIGKIFPFNIVAKVVPFFRAHSKLSDALWSHVLKKTVTTADEGFPHIYKAEFLDAYNKNNKRVRKVVPRRRLIIQDHAKGWLPLCRFLGKPVPESDYPHSNKRADMRAFIRKIGMTFVGSVMAAAVLLVVGIKWIIGLVMGRTSKSKNE